MLLNGVITITVTISQNLTVNAENKEFLVQSLQLKTMKEHKNSNSKT